MHHRSWRRGRVWKLTDPWTPRTRPPILAKPQNGFAQAPTRIINISLSEEPKTGTLRSVGVSYPQILRRRHNCVGSAEMSSGGNVLVPGQPGIKGDDEQDLLENLTSEISSGENERAWE
jgi:hypothetical protein